MGILFTRSCVLCGMPLDAEAGCKAMLCAACAEEVRTRYRLHHPISIPDADSAAAALYYTGTVRKAMQQFKFQHKQHYADWFSAQILPILAEHLDDWHPDLITYMPIGFVHLHKRGYNQAELLAKPIAAAFGLPCRATLRKRAFTPKQSTRKDAAARQQNAARALLPLANTDIQDKSVVLIDDIITTGATASAAVKLLRNIGAARVYVLAAAFTPHK